MQILRPLSILSLLLLLPILCAAQELEQSEKEKKGIEFIMSGVGIYETESEEFVFGAEFHLTKWFGETWGMGASYSLKFSEKLNQDIAVLASWNAASWLTLNFGPNFAIPKGEREFEVGAYLESEFNLRPHKRVNLGPVLGGVIGKSSEVSFGLHVGFEF